MACRVVLFCHGPLAFVKHGGRTNTRRQRAVGSGWKLPIQFRPCVLEETVTASAHPLWTSGRAGPGETSALALWEASSPRLPHTLTGPAARGITKWRLHRRAGAQNLGPCFFRIAPRIAPRIEPGQFQRGNPHHLPPRGKPVGDWCNGRRGSGARKARPSHLRPRQRDTHAATLTRRRTVAGRSHPHRRQEALGSGE